MNNGKSTEQMGIEEAKRVLGEEVLKGGTEEIIK